MTGKHWRIPSPLRVAALTGVALFALTPAQADETITYRYDTRGRLIKVAHSGTVNNGASACYTFDKSDNRTSVVTASSDCGTPPSFSVGNASTVVEGTSVSFMVSKVGTTSSSYSIDYATANGTAQAGSDYTSKSGTLTFAANETSKTVTVNTTDDSAVETAETLYLNLSNATGGATITDPQGVGTMSDNDNLPPVAGSDTITMACNISSQYFLLTNDSDPDGDPLTLTAVRSVAGGFTTSIFNAQQGIVTITSGSAAGSFNGQYDVSDGRGGTTTGFFTVNVTTGGQGGC